MRTFATLNPSEAARLAESLKSQRISFFANVSTEETGLVAVELLAEDDFFDEACNAAEAWLEAEYKEDAKSTKRFCPNCPSIRYEFVDDGTSAIIIRCPDCGYSVAI